MITNENIILDSNPLLRKKSKEVNFPLNNDELKLIKDMEDYLVNSNDEELAIKYNLSPGVGIAAPQIGILKKICSIYLDEDFKYTLINPTIISESSTKSCLKHGEGCLSVKNDHPGIILRSNNIIVKYFDINGNEKSINVDGFESIVIQHEIDHLNGRLFYDRINPFNNTLIPEGTIEIE